MAWRRIIERKFRLRVLAISVMILCLTGCGNKAKEPDGVQERPLTGMKYALGTDSPVVCNSIGGLGALMADRAYYWSDQALSYRDLNTGEEYLMCFNPTCDHKWRKSGSGIDYQWTTECTALLCGRNSLGSCMLGETFYSIKGRADDFEKVNLVTTGLDGTGDAVLATLDIQDQIRCAYWYRDEFLLLAYWNLYIGEQDETGRTEMESCIPGILQVSIKDGKVTKLVEKPMEGQQSIIQNLACDGERVWYSYEYTDTEGETVYEIRCVSLSTLEDRLILEGKGNIIGIDTEKVLYSDGRQSVSDNDIPSGIYVRKWAEEPTLLLEEMGYYTGISCGEQVYFTSNKGGSTTVYIYDVATQNCKQLMTVNNMQLALDAVFPDVVYFNRQGNSCPYGVAYISMENLLAGKSEEFRKLFDFNLDPDRYYER